MKLDQFAALGQSSAMYGDPGSIYGILRTESGYCVARKPNDRLSLLIPVGSSYVTYAACRDAAKSRCDILYR